MRAAFLRGPRDLRFSADVADPVPAPGEVLVRVARAGLCGSDLHVWRTGDFVTSFPVTPGHEVVGTVISTAEDPDLDGPEVALVGQRVVLDSRVLCGTCVQCVAGRFQRCPAIGFLGEVRGGGFAELVTVPAARTWTLPARLPFEIAVLAEPTAVVLHAWNRAKRVLEANDRARGRSVAILGAGPVGVLLALALPDDVEAVLVEPDERRAEIARRITGSDVIAPGTAADAYAGAVDAVFDCAGAFGSLGRAATLVRPGGTVVAVALHHRPDELDVNAVVAREVTLIGTHVFHDEMPAALARLAARPDRFGLVVDLTVTLEELPALVASAAEGRRNHLKLAVAP